MYPNMLYPAEGKQHDAKPYILFKFKACELSYSVEGCIYTCGKRIWNIIILPVRIVVTSEEGSQVEV